MNEDAQLEAMAAELTALGYSVRTDIRSEKLGVLYGVPNQIEGITLDLVAELLDPGEFGAQNPRMLVIEVANRRRPGRDLSSSEDRLLQYVDEDEAVRRFKSISDGLAGIRDAEFQIRFFDVSAEQAAARQLKGPLRTKEAMRKQIIEDRRLLVRSVGRDDLTRALVVARQWSHWLRMLGHLHPGSERRELKNADLRTIQKELFDQRLIMLPPGRYSTIHQSLLGAFEGGDFEIQGLLALEPDLRRILDWASERYGLPNTEAQPQPGNLFDRIRRQIEEKFVGQRREELEAAVTTLWIVQGTDVFPRVVADFLLAVGREPAIGHDLITELLERAANTAS